MERNIKSMENKYLLPALELVEDVLQNGTLRKRGRSCASWWRRSGQRNIIFPNWSSLWSMKLMKSSDMQCFPVFI